MSRSDVFHYRGLTYWSPLDVAKVERALDMMPLQRADTVLDLGCGRAEILVRLIERHDVRAVGVDRSPHALALARAEIDARTPDARIQLIEADAASFAAEPGSLAAISMLGAPRLGDGLAATLDRVRTWLRPGGTLLLGEGFWTRPPGDLYLAATGIAAGELTDHWGVIETGRRAGLTLLCARVSSRDEWDEFEGRILYNIEQYAAENHHDTDFTAELERRRAFHDAQQRWGRDCMGFGLYLFRR